MSDALPLPPRPNLDQYKKLAKDLHRAMNNAEGDAVSHWAEQVSETLLRLYGPHIASREREDIIRETRRIAQHWRKFQQERPANGQYKLTDAQLFLARAHGFASWPKFAKHLESLAAIDSPASSFESAADAIVNGDFETLRRLLREHPALVRERSTRSHRSTLLHYVSANGIEDFRQKTPPNIVEITKLLLDAGADVNAESDAYGGRSTTLDLAATSYHPEEAGVQLQLLGLLLDSGAAIDVLGPGSTVVACLRNGRSEAAEFLAGRGAKLDLEGACGVASLDVVRRYFPSGQLAPNVPQQQLIDGFAWACEFGKTAIVEFLLDHGVDVAVRVPHHGQTGLHWAALGGHLDAVKLLLDRGAPVDVAENDWGGTPLGWALHGWSEASDLNRDRYYGVVQTLISAGSPVKPEWLLEKPIQADPKMQQALAGQ